MTLRTKTSLLTQLAVAASRASASCGPACTALQHAGQHVQSVTECVTASKWPLASWGAALGLTQRRGMSTEIVYPAASAFISQPAPEFTAPAVVGGEIGSVSLSDYKGKWVVLFFYPKDFTFVCPTEIIAFSDRAKEFASVNTQLIAASTDTEEVHLAWIKTPRKSGGLGYMQIPIIADTTKVISAQYGVLLPKLGIPLRGLFIIDPKGVLRQVTINDLPVGRSVDETLRQVQALQFVEDHGEVCPANWKPGEKTMIADPEKSLDYFSTVHPEEEQLASKLLSISSPDEFKTLVDSGRPVIVDFYAPWCGKCRMIAPFLDELAAKYPNVTFAKLDTAAAPLQDFSATLGIKALPAFRFYKGGKQVGDQLTGYKKKPLEDAIADLAA